MKKLLRLVVTCTLLGASLWAQSRPTLAATSASNDREQTNPAIDACTEGVIIGATAAILGAFALDLLGGGGTVTALTAKIIVPSIVGGCVTGMMHNAVNRAKQPQTATQAATRRAVANRRAVTPVKMADRRR